MPNGYGMQRMASDALALAPFSSSSPVWSFSLYIFLQVSARTTPHLNT